MDISMDISMDIHIHGNPENFVPIGSGFRSYFRKVISFDRKCSLSV